MWGSNFQYVAKNIPLFVSSAAEEADKYEEMVRAGASKDELKLQFAIMFFAWLKLPGKTRWQYSPYSYEKRYIRNQEVVHRMVLDLIQHKDDIIRMIYEMSEDTFSKFKYAMTFSDDLRNALRLFVGGTGEEWYYGTD